MNSEIEEVNKMDVWGKHRVYAHYLSIQLWLKHGCQAWRNINIDTFEEFISEKNIDIRDNGENWNKNGYGARIWVQTYGIYDWYWKFKSEI